MPVIIVGDQLQDGLPNEPDRLCVLVKEYLSESGVTRVFLLEYEDGIESSSAFMLSPSERINLAVERQLIGEMQLRHAYMQRKRQG